MRWSVHIALVLVLGLGSFGRAAERPNILWITAEDMSPHLGCYGDRYTRTPNLDAFAREAVRYTHAFATAPVCSPARACLITGVYATSLGNPHLRCETKIPDFVRGFPAYLREAGYYTTNNVKTDYNLADEAAFVKDAWNESSPTAHWRGRRAGQPFFAVFNLMTTHQSRTSVWPQEEFEREVGSKLPREQRADPSKVPLPPIWPDTPLARQAMARYYDCIQAMDAEVGRILKELDDDGLADETIVFFYSDHGMGMPGGKRRLHDSGMHVPLLVRFPKVVGTLRVPSHDRLAPASRPAEEPAWTPGLSNRLVSFVDFAPTVLSLAGVAIPDHMQGTAFLGEAAGQEQTHVYGARDRVDEVFDTARSVRDKRWLYIRNYRPHLSWAQPEGYSDQSPFRQELLKLAREGKLEAGPMTYLAPTRPLEELYDTQADPYQLHNLAAQPQHREVLQRMRSLVRDWIVETRDLGFLPEADMLARAGDEPPYLMARREGAYPVARVLSAAELVSNPDALGQQRRLLFTQQDAGVRYWAAVGLAAAGNKATAAKEELSFALRDRSSPVRIEAAGVLAALGDHTGLDELGAQLGSSDWNAALHAARTLQLLGNRAAPVQDSMKSRLETVRQQEGEHSHALFVRFALEAALTR